MNRVSEIENLIANNQMTASQVFTQMRQLIESRNEVIEEAKKALSSCEKVDGSRIRYYEAVGAIDELKTKGKDRNGSN